MRILFFGTSSFAVPGLIALHNAAPRHTIIGVVTQPDRPKGRGRSLQMSPVKETAIAMGYEIHQPERVKRKLFGQTVADLKPDALVVISFGQIIPQTMLDDAKFGGINLHASLLPRWRGAAPIHRAIIAGDAQTGVATMRMEATLDTGGIFLTAVEPILPTDTVENLEARLSQIGAPLLVQTLDGLENGTITETPQSEFGMTYAHPVLRPDGFLDPHSGNAQSLERRIRGTFPRPGAFIVIAGKPVKALAATVLPETTDEIGKVTNVDKQGIGIGTSLGTLLLTNIQPENKAAMSAADWARGARIMVGDSAVAPTETEA